MNWIDTDKYENIERLRDAGNHLVVIPSQHSDAPLDTVDVFDGSCGEFIVTAVPEKLVRELVVIWNGLVDSGESVESLRTINLSWLTGVTTGKTYSA